MKFRRYEKGDYQALCDFFAALNRENRQHINWNWARFEWMYGHPEFDVAAQGSMGLWLAEDRVAGAAVYDMYFGEAFCGVLPGYETLYPEVLAYAWEILRDEEGLGIGICDRSPEEQRMAREAGFTPEDQTETVLALDLAGFSPTPLPAGCRLRELDQTADAEALEWLFWHGFDHGEDRAEFERSERIPARSRPHFNRHLSLAAVDDTGEPTAVCCLWYLPGTDYAYVEPVCTVPAHRGRGLARALLGETLTRAKALGARKAYVISDLDFYKHLGFAQAEHYTFYFRREKV